MIENIALKIQNLILKIGSIFKINSDNVNQFQKNEYKINKAVFLSPIQPSPQDLITGEIKKLTSSTTKPKSVHKIVLGNYLGVVIDPNLSGTTVNIEFAISNGKSAPLIIKGVSGEFEAGELNFKGFFKFLDEGKQRVPDLNRRFPLVVAPNGADRLEIILENLDKELITKGNLKGKVLVLTGEDEVVQENFILSVDDRFIQLIKDTQDLSRQKNLPFVFDAMIKS